jgi:class 3 adenylate cyclase
LDFAGWLRQLGLERYEAAFRDAEVSADILPDLTDSDLEKLGLPLGPRKKLLKAISSLPLPSAAPAGETALTPRPATADRRQVTIMFVDLVGSTMLARQLDTEDYRAVIAGFQQAVSMSVSRFDGHVAKYLGDGVMACFGFPRAHEDDPERAVRAALDVLQAVRLLTVPPRVLLRARIGVATGVEAVGDLAEVPSPEQGAILGDTPNLASRLQGVADPGSIIVGQRTHALIAGLFDCEPLPPQYLKGIAEPEPAWRIVGERRSESRFEARHGAGLTPYVGREDEIELLVRRWRRARDGEGQIVLISGEAGLGKSRLAQRLRERLAGETHLRLHYQCSPHHTNSALYPVSAQIAFAAGVASDDPTPAKLDKLEALLADGADDVAAVAPLIADLLSIPDDGRYPRDEPDAAGEEGADARHPERATHRAVAKAAGAGAVRRPPLGRPDDPGASRADDRSGQGLPDSRAHDLPARIRAKVGRAAPCHPDRAQSLAATGMHRDGSHNRRRDGPHPGRPQCDCREGRGPSSLP